MVAGDPMREAFAKVTATLPEGGEDRPGQLRMAEAVDRAIEKARHLVVQAGTGTGKSLAYLVPAVLSGRRVVVATATKALQDQLAQKDLPALARALDRPVSFAVLKGRSNYLCLQRAAEAAGGGVQQELGAAPPADPTRPDATVVPDVEGGAGALPGSDDAQNSAALGLVEQVRALLEWVHRTDTGDRAELPFEPSHRAWSMLSVGPRECPGASRCPEGSRCFAERARSRAARADVVVVNAHLYGAHLASGGVVLPPHEVVVFDEAHELEEVMTDSLGVDVSPGRLRALDAMSRPLVEGEDVRSADLTGVAERLRLLLADRIGRRVSVERLSAERLSVEPPERPPGRERSFFGLPPGPFRDGTPVTSQSSDDELADLLELAAARLEELRARVLGAGGPTESDGSDSRRARALAAAGSLAVDLARFADRGEDDVVWVDGTPDAPVLTLSPVDVGPLLSASLWGEATAILTSATIPPRVEDRLGLTTAEAGVDHLDVGSPFDFRSHSLLYVARHLPDRRRPDSEPALLEELVALIRAAGGRTLALFTSRRATESAARAIATRIPHRLLVQGELPKRRLLELFSKDETSCLFATLGFWQGVDIPGRSLSLVTVDRLPFGRPDDPLLEARRERAGSEAFELVDLPRAATLLAQGVGRLIRTSADRGVVAVLDPRLATAGYRRVLLDALPPMRRTVQRDEVIAFFDGVFGTDR